MTYLELNENEKHELRNTLYFEKLYNSEDSYLLSDLTNEQDDIICACDSPEDIPESIMQIVFGIYDFSPDDFWCNIDAEDKTE